MIEIQNMKVILTSICMFNLMSMGRGECEANFIERHAWQENGVETYCCRKVLQNCKPGTYLKKCIQHLGQDECKPCPGVTWLADETNSDNVHPCLPYNSCSSESKRVNYIPESGCHEPCICDTDRNFYGYDSCNCKLYQEKCQPGTKLTLNGTCLPDSIADEFNNLRPDTNLVIIPIREKSDGNGNKAETSISGKEFWDIGRWIITGVAVLGLFVIVIGCCIVRKQKLKKRKADYNDIENPPPETIEFTETPSIHLLSDSGISVTTTGTRPEQKDPIAQEFHATVDCEQISESLSHSSDKTEKQVAMITPFTSDNDDRLKECNPLLYQSVTVPLVNQDLQTISTGDQIISSQESNEVEDKEGQYKETLLNVPHDLSSRLSLEDS